jgi:hypothetical protein
MAAAQATSEVKFSPLVPLGGDEESKKKLSEYEASIATWQAGRQAACSSVDGISALFYL